FVQTRRVEHLDFEVAKAGLALTPVAGDPRSVIDQRQTLSDQAIEQRGLADIRPSDDGDRDAHGVQRWQKPAGSPPPGAASVSASRWLWSGAPPRLRRAADSP